MSIRSSIYPSQFVGASTLDLTQLHNVNIVNGVNKDVIVPAGSIDPAAIPMMFAAPIVTFSSRDIAGVLAIVSVTAGLYCSSGAIIQFQRRTNGGTFAGSGSHVKLTSTLGWLGITGFSSAQDGSAEVQLAYYPLYDGTNEPLTATGSVSLSLSPAFNSQFSLGPVYANGVEFVGIQNISVDPGINFQTNRESGDVFAKRGAIYGRMPTFSFTTFSAAIAAQTNILFNAALPGTLAFYLWKLQSGRARIDVATTENVKLSAATGVWGITGQNGSENGDVMTTVSAQATGTMASSAASAIP